MKLICIYVTFPDQESARKMSELLLSARQVACANIHQIESHYEWKDALVRENEWVGRFKTLPEKWDSARQMIEKHHNYEVPCILCLPITDANSAYLEWVRKQCN